MPVSEVTGFLSCVCHSLIPRTALMRLLMGLPIAFSIFTVVQSTDGELTHSRSLQNNNTSGI